GASARFCLGKRSRLHLLSGNIYASAGCRFAGGGTLTSRRPSVPNNIRVPIIQGQSRLQTLCMHPSYPTSTHASTREDSIGGRFEQSPSVPAAEPDSYTFCCSGCCSGVRDRYSS